MDLITYALLRKRITSALTGIKDIRLDEPNQDLIFITNDDTEFKIHIPTPDLIYIGPDEPSADSGYKLWVDTSDEGTDGICGCGGTSALQKDLIASTIIGSVTSGKLYPEGTELEEIIRDILISYSKPVITLETDPTTDVYDVVTDTINNITSIVKATRGTYDITKITFLIDNVPFKTITTGVENGGTFTENYAFDTPKNKTFVLKVVAEDGIKETTITKTIVFIGKSYYGTVADTVSAPTEADIKGLQFTALKNSRALTYKDISVVYGKVLYAYPKSLGALTKIVDADNRDYTGSYTSGEVKVDDIDYYYYILTDAMGTDDGYQKFA